jgi:hypothetical protein
LRTIFSANRKHFSRPVYVRVQELDDHYRYMLHYSREDREEFEADEINDVRRWCWRPSHTLYRVNVYPKHA